jgi:RNA polymerase sigma factor (sigma-70 family)
LVLSAQLLSHRLAGTKVSYRPLISPELLTFEAFYRKEYPRLAGSLRLVCGSDELAEEFAQEAFTRALNHWDRLVTYDRPAGWVYRVGFNEMRRYWRKKKRGDGPLVIEPVVRDDQTDRVDLVRVLSRLPLAQREAVVLRHVLDYSTDETAEMMGLQPGALRMTLHRAVQSLRHDHGLQVDDEGEAS